MRRRRCARSPRSATRSSPGSSGHRARFGHGCFTGTIPGNNQPWPTPAPEFLSSIAPGWLETAVYVVIGAVLIVTAGLLLGEAAYDLATEFEHGVVPAAQQALDSLLLTFIFVELFAAVRVHRAAATSSVAEPFFLVGIIASIKEIVLPSAPRT